MLEFITTNELKPNIEFLELIKDFIYTINKGKVKHLLKTNLQFIEQDLRVLGEYNNLKLGQVNDKNSISEFDINKIMNYSLYIYKTVEINNDNFSAVDHFVRLNKNNYTIKDNTYRMWSLICDKKILEYEREITNRFTQGILPSANTKRSADLITFKLACLFFYNDFKEIKFNNYSNRRVSLWIKEFNTMKDKYLFRDDDKIEIIRRKYISALDDVKLFYDKVSYFLENRGKSIRDLVAVKGSASIPLSNSDKIYEIINDFFVKIKVEKLDNEHIIHLLKFTVKEISIFDSTKRYQFKDKLNNALNK